MRNKFAISWLLPLLAALLLLSLPVGLNRSLRDSLACKVSCLISSFSGNEAATLEPPEKEAFSNWLQERSDTKKKTLRETEVILQELGFSQALIGDVIARPKNTFESFFWINLGTNDNPKEGPAHIAKWSPVLSGDAVVGVVEYVGKSSSLVRLISDPELHIAVRVVRGGPEVRSVRKAIAELQNYQNLHPELFTKKEERTAFQFLLQKMGETLDAESNPLMLAKGEIRGNLHSPFLDGVGFNYDFRDSYGEARDLRTGEAVGHKGDILPLVQCGDLLQTSGMDGIFPEGLSVAKIESIAPLQEGAFSYELSARPAANNLRDLRSVIVLAPRSEEVLQLPTRGERILQELNTLCR